jgi:hypothetical protein
MCKSNLHNLGTAIKQYADENSGEYPAPDQWCDSLLEYSDSNPPIKAFRCRLYGEGRCHYGMNTNVEPDSPNDVVLLFETEGVWNQHGGPELLNTENHGGEGCNILFNDGRFDFVEPEELEKLKWH